MNPTAIYSKTGKGVQEASGKTSILSRADRIVLQAFDGRASMQEVNLKFDKIPQDKLQALVDQMEKDGFIRLVSGGAPAAASSGATQKTTTIRNPAPAAPAAAGADPDEELDFTALTPAATR